jgi:hypothetical protein
VKIVCVGGWGVESWKRVSGWGLYASVDAVSYIGEASSLSVGEGRVDRW